MSVPSGLSKSGHHRSARTAEGTGSGTGTQDILPRVVGHGVFCMDTKFSESNICEAKREVRNILHLVSFFSFFLFLSVLLFSLSLSKQN